MNTIISFAHSNWDKFKKLTINRHLSHKEIDEVVVLATDTVNTATRRNTTLMKVDEFQYNFLMISFYT